MRTFIFSVLVALAIATTAKAQSPEERCRVIAQRQYPNDTQMQRFIYDKQIAAYRYMANVKDKDVKEIALKEYPDDFDMQKFVYDQQGEAKQYMTTVRDAQVKKFALKEYPHDYSMQKFTYDKQQAAKTYMATVTDANAKRIALREYPHDFDMQKYVYDKHCSVRHGVATMPREPAKSKKKPGSKGKVSACTRAFSCWFKCGQKDRLGDEDLNECLQSRCLKIGYKANELAQKVFKNCNGDSPSKCVHTLKKCLPADSASGSCSSVVMCILKCGDKGSGSQDCSKRCIDIAKDKDALDKGTWALSYCTGLVESGTSTDSSCINHLHQCIEDR